MAEALKRDAATSYSELQPALRRWILLDEPSGLIAASQSEIEEFAGFLQRISRNSMKRSRHTTDNPRKASTGSTATEQQQQGKGC